MNTQTTENNIPLSRRQKTYRAAPPYVNRNLLRGLRDCRRVGLQRVGTAKSPTPANIFRDFGFDLTVQPMSAYILTYAPIIFIDKSYQDLKAYIERRKPRFEEKALTSDVMRHFNRYFKTTLTEGSKDLATLMDLFDEAQDKWTETMRTMDLAFFNATSRYFADAEECHRFCELLLAYAWLNFGGDVLKETKMMNDQEAWQAQLAFSKLLRHFIGKNPEEQRILAEVRGTITTGARLVFMHLREMAEKRKAIEKGNNNQ